MSVCLSLSQFASKHVCPEAENSIRDIVALPTSMGGFIEQAGGGFATASLDKCIRVYSIVGECLMTLKGHTGGVISLDVGHDGKLISGKHNWTYMAYETRPSQSLLGGNRIHRVMGWYCPYLVSTRCEMRRRLVRP